MWFEVNFFLINFFVLNDPNVCVDHDKYELQLVSNRLGLRIRVCVQMSISRNGNAFSEILGYLFVISFHSLYWY